MRQFLLLFAFAPFALNSFAQSPLIFGARGGAPFTGSGLVSSSLGLSGHPFVIGPTAGVRLPLGFSVEGDALYKREDVSLPLIGSLGGLGVRSDSWQIPVMLKYTAGSYAIAPVFGAGVSIRHINNIQSELLTGTLTKNTVGFVAGAGLRFKAGPVNITPELRYTRWNSRSFTQSLLNALTPSSNNEAQALIGITF